MIHDDKECGGEQDKRGPTGIYERRRTCYVCGQRGCREEEMDIEKAFDADSDSVYFGRRFNIVINIVKIQNTRSGRLPLRHNMSLAWKPL